MIAAGKGAGVGDGEKVARKRATGTREHVVAYLAEAGELYDKDGLASTRLAAAVGYPGSSVAFAQLLSGMERSGLIVREVHGKRTYRIALGDVDGFGPVSRAPARPEPAPLPGDFDYDELARRLLVQVVRQLAADPGQDRRPVPRTVHDPKSTDLKSTELKGTGLKRTDLRAELNGAEVVLRRLLSQDLAASLSLTLTTSLSLTLTVCGLRT